MNTHIEFSPAAIAYKAYVIQNFQMTKPSDYAIPELRTSRELRYAVRESIPELTEGDVTQVLMSEGFRQIELNGSMYWEFYYRKSL